jgi:class 3 adenylate cyclase
MENSHNNPTGPGQRSLAAIVFTDVVSFSARMQADEVATLRLLQRDFAAMREICTEHQGSVLKTTGDGLLLYFSSAVQAVACALAMQRLFAGQAKKRPATETLNHRLGIHLGDVFVNDQDVMGDGVNIAARLQAEAEPGGICISQTVYDVVKNKLALHVTRLGPRELKNISQHIPIYRLLLEAQTMGEAELPPEEEYAAPASRPLTRNQKRAGAAGLVVLVLLLIFQVVWTSIQKKTTAAQAEATRAKISALLAEDAADTANREKNAKAVAEWREELRDRRSRAQEEYNFAELARDAGETRPGVANKPDTQIRLQMLERMQTLFGWLATAMQRYSREKPLVTHELTGTAPKEIRVFGGADRRLYYAEGGAIRQQNWADLHPPVMGAIIAGVLLDAQPFPPREVVLGAQDFANFYALPELGEALRKGRPKRPVK